MNFRGDFPTPTFSCQSPSSSFLACPSSVTPNTMSYQTLTASTMLHGSQTVGSQSVTSLPGSSLMSAPGGIGQSSQSSSPNFSLTQPPSFMHFPSVTNSSSSVAMPTPSLTSVPNPSPILAPAMAASSHVASLHRQPGPPPGIPAAEYAGYVAQFAALDGDGDGFLSAQEGRVVLSQSVLLPAHPLLRAVMWVQACARFPCD
jgi:hypothetical protein